MNNESQKALTEAEERRLGELIAQGDQKALDRLVTANIGFVVSVARQYNGKGLPLDDLVSEGNIAMMLAAMKWDPSKGTRFVQYAVWDIRKAIEHAIDQQVNVVRKPISEKSHLSQVSMDAPLRVGYTRTLGETMPARDQRSQYEETDNSSMNYGLARGLQVLSPREQEVIRKFYGLECETKTMMEIGIEMNLKRERVRQIRKKAERKLRKPMREL